MVKGRHPLPMHRLDRIGRIDEERWSPGSPRDVDTPIRGATLTTSPVGLRVVLELSIRIELLRQELRRRLLRLLGHDDRHFFGVALMVLGMCFVFYTSHKRYTSMLTEKKGARILLFAGKSSRFRAAFAEEFRKVSAGIESRLRGEAPR